MDLDFDDDVMHLDSDADTRQQCAFCKHWFEPGRSFSLHASLSQCAPQYTDMRDPVEPEDLLPWERVMAGLTGSAPYRNIGDSCSVYSGDAYQDLYAASGTGSESDCPGPWQPLHEEAVEGVAECIGKVKNSTYHMTLEEEERFDRNTFHPFVDESEWEVASWLARSGMSDSQINKFLTLEYVGGKGLLQHHFLTI